MAASKKGDKSAPVKKGRDLYTIIANVEKGIGGKGGGHLIVMSDESKLAENIQVLPSGMADVDAATNIGGIPRGRIIEIFGPEQSGKSFISMKVVAKAQRDNLTCAYLDIENAMDRDWAIKNDIQYDSLIYGKSFDNGEQALDAAYSLCQQKVDVIVVDSTAALVPKAELEGSLQDTTVAELARMMSKGIRKINDAVGKTGSTVIFVNQLRMKAGFVLGNPEDTPGGKALKFYASMRLDVRAREKIKGKGGKIIGIRSRVKCVKNKLGPPFGEGMFDIYFDPKQMTPEIRAVRQAIQYKLAKAVKQEGDDGQDEAKKLFVFGKGKDAEETGCDNEDDLLDWIVENDKMEEMLSEISEVAKANKDKLDPEIVKLIASSLGEETPEAPAVEKPEAAPAQA